MRNIQTCLLLAALLLVAPAPLTPAFGQNNDAASSPALASAPAAVPRLVQFSSVAKDANGKALTGTIGITFLLYSEEQGGAPLWMETQNVQADTKGHYSVPLGATKPEGLPAEAFNSVEARWLGVQIAGQEEQPRVLLLAVPYALKAADASTIGGLPPSAFVRANSEDAQPRGNTSSGTSKKTSGVAPQNQAQPETLLAVKTVAPGNTIGFVPLWSGSKSPTNQIASSNLFQSGSNVGLGTTSPAALFDVNGTGGFRDSLTLFPKGSDPTLSVQGTAFGISSTGLVSFVSGQTFPGTGNGTITGVTAGTDLTGGGSSGNVTLNLDTTKVPQLGTANTFTANQTINGNLSATFLGAQIAGFTGSSSSSILLVQQKESGFNAIAGLASGAGSVGVEGEGDTGVSGSGTTTGVSASGTKQGMEAEGLGAGSIGVTALGQAFGVVAQTLATSGNTQGVEALATSPNGIGTLSTAIGESKTGRSLIFCCPVGVWGDTAATAPGAAGLVGTADNAQAIVALNNTTSTSLFTANIQNLENTTHKVPVMNVSGAFGHCTADTDGDLACTGTISKGGGSFKIDHPLDPANKYLYHSFVESPDMMNIYNGVVTLGEGGAASVQLPDYFEALNRDFRYQLTSLGRSQPDLYIAREVSSNSFEIAGGQPGGRVSWQVTGIRHDAYAEAHRIQTEVEKAPEERGKYLHPDLFGAPLEELIGRSAPPPVASAVSTGPTRAEMTK